MLKSYWKVAWRNLTRSKVYSMINIAGLAAGMAVAMIIGLWINDELSTNKHFANYNNLYQVRLNQTFDGQRGTQPSMPYPLGTELKAKYPDMKGVAMCDWGADHSLIVGDRKISLPGHFIGEDATDMFSLKILKGDAHPLHDPYSIVLTEETAIALFSNQDPIGKIVRLDNGTDLKVTAVVPKQPKTSALTFDYLIPFQLQDQIYSWSKNARAEWGDNSWLCFVQLNKNVSAKTEDAKIKDLIFSKRSDRVAAKAMQPEIFLHPMSKWRLYNDFENGVTSGGFIKYVRLFGILGLIVLLIACINFMNLSTARSEKRAKEVGVRKAVGSGRSQLIRQFLSESMLIATLSFIVALGMVFLALPYFNQLTEKEMTLQIASPVFWGIMILFTILTGLLAGSYPAFYLSSFSPVRVLKGNLKHGTSSSLPRKILVVIQFASSVVLMIGTTIIYQQIQFGKSRPIGFDNRGLLSVNWSDEIGRNFDALHDELLSSGVVASLCKSNSEPSNINSDNNGWEWPGSSPEEKTVTFTTIASEYDYTKTLGIKMLDGRDFSRDYADSSSVILNESAVKRMHLAHPVGTPVKYEGNNLTVIGVVPDLQMESPFQMPTPLTIIFRKNWVHYLDVRIKPGVSVSAAISRIRPIFDKYNPAFPFQYKFADQEYERKFNYEELVGNLAAIIAGIAIFISCLGLFGLSSFTAEQRFKEIGVRKVLGANSFNLWRLLSKDFVVLVLISCGIAIPVAWYGMHAWLESYKYQVPIGLGVFVAVIFISVFITLVTVSFQAIKAASANPIRSLRTE